VWLIINSASLAIYTIQFTRFFYMYNHVLKSGMRYNLIMFELGMIVNTAFTGVIFYRVNYGDDES